MTTNAQVGHLWAAHNMGTTAKRSARSSNGNFHFDGPSIYSYSTELARFTRAPSGDLWVLHNVTTYSITTSGKHQPAINRALNYGKLVRTIELDVGQRGSWLERNASDPRGLAVTLMEEASELQDKARKVRESKHAASRREWMLERASDKVADAAWLNEAYGLSLGSLDEVRAQITAEREGAIAWQGFVRAINEVASIPTAIYDNAMRSLGDIAAGVSWLAGARFPGEDRVVTYGRGQYHYRANQYRHERPYELPTLLRINGDTVETSQGASFPLADGLRALPFIERAIREERAYDFTPRLDGLSHGRPRLGHFAIDNVSAAGWVRAGCHTVPGFAVRWADGCACRQVPGPRSPRISP